MNENKHSSYDLAQMQSLPLDAKIRMSEYRIRQWYEVWDGQVYVSFSGGKDSTVLLHLVRSLYPEVEVVYVDTGLEYPELREHVKSIENVTWLKPKMNFKEVIKKYGYPMISKDISKRVKDGRAAIKNENPGSYALVQLEGRYLTPDGRKSPYNCEKWHFLLDAPFNISSQCCDVMKKRPIHKYEKITRKKPFVGTMAYESRQRKTIWIKQGCNAFNKNNPSSQPLSFWTEQDIFEYIQRFNLKIPSVYGEIIETGNEVERIDGMHKELRTSGCDRTGCMFCMFGCHLEKSPNRFEMMKQTHPKIYDYCMRSTEEGGLGMKEVIDWLNENGNLNIRY